MMATNCIRVLVKQCNSHMRHGVWNSGWMNTNSSVKTDQLDVTCIISLLNAQHVSYVNTSILRSLWLMCWVISWVVSGSMCVGVTLRFGCGGVVSVCRLRHYCLSLLTDTTPPQPYHNVTPTHIEPYQCNPWNNSTHKSQAPEDGCINIWNTLSTE